MRDDEGDKIGIMLGAFDEPAKIPPQYHYRIEGRLPWSDAGRDLPGKETKEVTGL